MDYTDMDDMPTDDFEEPETAPAGDGETLPNALTLTFSHDTSDMLSMIAGKAASLIVRQIEYKLTEEVSSRVTRAIDARINEIVEQVLARKFQPVDGFGSPQGAETTIRDMIAKKAERFMDEKVDSDGRASNSYNARPRLDCLVDKVVRDTLDFQMKKQVNEIATRAKADVERQVAEMIVKVVSAKA
jgi:thymidine kinase